MGDCPPDYGCPDKNAAMVRGIAQAVPIVAVSAIMIGLATALLRRLLLPHMRPLALRTLLIGFALAALWFGFSPAFDLHFWLGTRL